MNVTHRHIPFQVSFSTQYKLLFYKDEAFTFVVEHTAKTLLYFSINEYLRSFTLFNFELATM
jgi:hypothetical protein